MGQKDRKCVKISLGTVNRLAGAEELYVLFLRGEFFVRCIWYPACKSRTKTQHTKVHVPHLKSMVVPGLCQQKYTDLRDHKCNRPNVVGKDEDYCS
jgi:hypothetical protein